jgi:hypothetical protein
MAIGSAPGQNPINVMAGFFTCRSGPARQPRFAHGLVKNDNQFAYASAWLDRNFFGKAGRWCAPGCLNFSPDAAGGRSGSLSPQEVGVVTARNVHAGNMTSSELACFGVRRIRHWKHWRTRHDSNVRPSPSEGIRRACRSNLAEQLVQWAAADALPSGLGRRRYQCRRRGAD